jgi:hypothetical protein
MRNMGNQGECSAGQLPWMTRDSGRYVLEIPWTVGADSVSVVVDRSQFGFIARRMVTLKVEVERGRALRLVADLPKPTLTDSAGIIYGTLRLRWFDHGRSIAADSGPARPARDYRPRREEHDKHRFVPVNPEAFSLTRRLCLMEVPATVANRSVPSYLPPQIVLNDSPTDAPAVGDQDSCGGADRPAGDFME